MEFTSSEAEERYAALVAVARRPSSASTSTAPWRPIVDDPEDAHIHPDAPEVLVDLAAQVRAVAVITGRPARQVLALGGLDEVGNADRRDRPRAVRVRAVRQRALDLHRTAG